MNYFLSEKESLDVINSIRIEPFAKMQSNEIKINGDTKISSNIEIVPFHNIWNSITLSVTVNDLQFLDFELTLNSNQFTDKLVLANKFTQKYNNSNIFEVIEYMFNQVWVPIAKGELTVTEEQYNDLLPDTFQLVGDSLPANNKISNLFDFVTSNTKYSNLLYNEFFIGTQPIYVHCQDFLDFCDKYKIEMG